MVVNVCITKVIALFTKCYGLHDIKGHSSLQFTRSFQIAIFWIILCIQLLGTTLHVPC